jgi:ribosomal protein S18 acetylase RimI-like enzyme
MKTSMDAGREIGSPLGMLRLRPERAEDDAFRFELFCQSRPAEFALLSFDAATLEQLMRFQFQAQTQSYRTNFPDARFDIIELDNAPIGRIVVDRSAGVLRIVDQALAQHARNRGLGTTIMTALLNEAAGTGVPVRLMVAPGNQAAMRLYLRLGFVAVKTELYAIEMEWRARAPDSQAQDIADIGDH